MSLTSLVPALTLASRESAFVLIALAQGALVFFLCLASKSRFASIVIGAAGLVVAAMVGDNRYAWLDVLVVLAATVAAIKSLSPHGGGGAPAQITAVAGQAVAWGVVILVAVGVAGWYLLSAQTKPAPIASAPLWSKSNRGEYVAPRARSSQSGSTAVAVVPRASRIEKLDRENQRAAGEGRRGGDLRRCLDLKDNAAIARCVGG